MKINYTANEAVAIWKVKSKSKWCDWVDRSLVCLCAFLTSHEWAGRSFFLELLLEWGQQYLTFFTGSFFPSSWPQPSSTAPVTMFLSSLQPSILFVSVLQLPAFLLFFFNTTYISLLSSSVLFQSLNWPQLHCVPFLVCARLWQPPWVSLPSNPDSSALFLLLWWMLVCFSFAGRIVALWEQDECFSPATGVLGWGAFICSCLNERGEFHLGFSVQSFSD